jgi:hypothetical protein
MISYIKKYWFLILLASAASILGLVKLLFPLDQTIPNVVSISPRSASTIESQLAEIEIKLDQEVSDVASFSLYTVPEIKTEKTKSEKGLVFKLLQELENNQKYLFELKYKNITIYSWSYQTNIQQTIPTSSPATGSSEIGDPEAVEKIAKSVLERYPLVKYVPFENDNFALDYSAPLILSVKIKSGDKTDIKWQVYEWLKEKGVDPDSHQIEWLDN